MTSTDQKILSISLIIPTLNEELAIGPCLDHLPKEDGVEILVVDGGSTDRTIQEIEARGLRALCSRPGRGSQQHVGAKASSGDILLFLHCDTRLPQDFIDQILVTLQQPKVAAGAFRLAIDACDWRFRWIEAGVQLRSTFCSLPYGDQALFMARKTYLAVGGFPDQPIMEDVTLVKQLRQHGRVAIAPAQVITSARRWQRHGLIKTTLINQLMLLGRLAGISPHQLAGWYYKERK